MEYKDARPAPDMSAKEYAAEIADALRAIPREDDRRNAATYLCGVAQGLLTAAQMKHEKPA